ncbi:MAG: hypothetical protein HXX08_12230 [Chloroflexi bacterium]|uniref:Uncharacterized protein n=1 Tax=Candidatus Chlorohelix allophototropha TaxID=3003348 RepID=A0A8T7M2G9_9CHLR|nr:hypothetical protein [Chloroflexota bacterium]WJW66009.1 hypothetical protein OZ401_001791 [Chloroflexota bacterium L227-S17]
MASKRIEEIIEYIRQTDATYTREAINQALKERGYSAEEISNGWKDAEKLKEPRAEPRISLVKAKSFWLALFGFLLGVPIFTALFAILGALLSNNSPYSIMAPLLGALFVLIVLIWVVSYITGHWKDNMVVSRGLLTGLVLTIVLPFIPFFIVAGICTTYSNWK